VQDGASVSVPQPKQQTKRAYSRKEGGLHLGHVNQRKMEEGRGVTKLNRLGCRRRGYKIL